MGSDLNRVAASLVFSLAGSYDGPPTFFHSARAASLFPLYMLGQTSQMRWAATMQRVPSSRNTFIIGCLVLLVCFGFEMTDLGASLVDDLPECEWSSVPPWSSSTWTCAFWCF